MPYVRITRAGAGNDGRIAHCTGAHARVTVAMFCSLERPPRAVATGMEDAA
jgi:hypothetical protein